MKQYKITKYIRWPILKITHKPYLMIIEAY